MLLDSAKHEQSVKILADKLRTEHASRPVLLLGAGASVTSGVPLAAELVRIIGRHAHAERELGSANAFANVMLTDGMNFLRRQSWFNPEQMAECFPAAVQHLLRPQAVRQQFFIQHTHHQRISEGYLALGKLFSRQLCRTVLTTNFDALLWEVLSEHKIRLREVVELNRSPGDLARFNVNNRCQIVYLHGSIEHYTDQNLPEEVQTLNEPLAARLWPMLADAPLIVVGYRGAEPSIVQHLLRRGVKESYGFKYGIYWCCRKPDDLHPQVQELAKAMPQNFSLLKINGFDELMVDLEAELAGETFLVEERSNGGGIPSWDRQPAEGATMEEIDDAALLAALGEYCERLDLGSLDRSRLSQMLLDRALAVRTDGGELLPTNACLLLFGKNPQQRFPHAVVTLVSERRKQAVFGGSLLRQFRDLQANLETLELNPVLRLKNATGAEETRAYAHQSVKELIANMLAHRNYEILEFGMVRHELGQSLTFSNPGGLVAEVRRRVEVQPDGSFQPKRDVSHCRNQVLADIFCGLGQMDKQGSGLPDVQEAMPKHGGHAEFHVRDGNTHLEVKLLQAEQPAASQPVANRRTQTEVYTTNLLAFKLMPTKVYQIPTFDPNLRRPIFQSDEEREHLPLCLPTGGWLTSFADLRQTPSFSERHGSLAMLHEWDRDEFLSDEVRQRHFVWLVGLHWRRRLTRFRSDGLYDDFRCKRAFFHLLNGQANTIAYTSWLGRRARRDVVKARGEQKQEHENEGFGYRVVEMGGEWAIQVNPNYVFTGPDGRTPLPPRFQSSRSTRRMKFDRNKMVGDDLMFWSRYLGEESEAVNLGLGWNDDLLLDMRFVFAELPVEQLPS